MPTAWPTNVRTDYDANKATRTSRVLALRNRHEGLLRQPWGYTILAVGTTSTSIVTIASIPTAMADWMIGRTLHVLLDAQMDTAAATGEIYIRDIDPTPDVDGPIVGVANVGAYAEVELTLSLAHVTIGDATFFNRGLKIVGRRLTGAGQILIQSVDRITAWVSD